jgi:TolB-like protein/DNA-binding SARP family transcriptional activator
MDARPGSSFTLRVLGGFELRAADGRDVSPAGKKQRALIACLALSPGTAWSRERLTALLWGDRDEEQARGSLRQSLVELRRIGISPLQATRETVALEAGTVAVDAVEFMRLAEAGELQQAAELYRGELLDGVSLPDAGFANWLLLERTRLHDLAIAVLSRLLAAQSGETAIKTAQRLLQLDPVHEETHRSLMRLYAAHGDRVRALQQYQICRDALQSDLNIGPQAETNRLYQLIKENRAMSERTPGRAPAAELSAETSSMPDPTSGVHDSPQAAPESLGERRAEESAEPAVVHRAPPARRPPLLLWLARLRQPRLALGALALVALIAAGSLAWNRYADKPDIPSIAVLPFDNLSGDPKQEYIVDGITDHLTAALSRFRDLSIIASDSTSKYKGKEVDAQQAGQELGVRYILQGSIQKEDDRVRIAVQLVDAASNHEVWASVYDGQLDDIFHLQADIVGRIAGTLASVTGLIAGEELKRAKHIDTDKWQAYDHLLIAQELLTRFTKEDNDKSREEWNKAIALDPNYAQAYVGLCWTYLLGHEYKFDPSPEESLERAFELAKKSVELDPTDADTRWVLAYAFLYQRKHDYALQEYQRAVELNPNYADLMSDMTFVLALMGRAEEGLAYMEKAKRLNPNYPDWYLWNFALAYYTLHRYSDAIANLKAADLPTRYRLYLPPATPSWVVWTRRMRKCGRSWSPIPQPRSDSGGTTSRSNIRPTWTTISTGCARQDCRSNLSAWHAASGIGTEPTRKRRQSTSAVWS